MFPCRNLVHPFGDAEQEADRLFIEPVILDDQFGLVPRFFEFAHHIELTGTAHPFRHLFTALLVLELVHPRYLDDLILAGRNLHVFLDHADQAVGAFMSLALGGASLGKRLLQKASFAKNHRVLVVRVGQTLLGRDA